MAVLVVDIQNDFCHPNGAFAKRGLNVKPAQAVVPRIKAFIEKVRAHEIPVIYSRQIESDTHSPRNLKKQFESGKLNPVCSPDSWGAELYLLEPTDGELVVEKYTYDVLSSSSAILKLEGTDTVIVTGVNTDICIDTTVRSAFTKGFNIIIPRDLVATMNPEVQEHYLKVFDQFFGTVSDSESILAYLSKQIS